MLNEITVRKMPFEFPSDIDAVFVEGDHKRSFNFIAGSLLLPHLEPYLIRSMKAAEKYVTDPVVAEGLDKFVRQEAQHYQMHKKFNDTVRLAGFPELASFEKELSDDYHRFTSTKSLKFNLAYAEGFEALTMNAVKHMMEPNGFGEDLPPFMQMVEWHFVEELEHRTVTFDVYEHVFGDYLYRLFVGVWAQWHFSNWMRRVAAYMLEVRPQQKIDKTIDREEKLARVQPASVGNLLPGLLRIYLPNYTPHDVKISPGIQQLADKYTNMALETS
ncbi:MAG: metal-dependent hydrolase [Pseudomonadales bacterium]|nr:metal-dependent hydrolase [Pseudomonadales bacterium]MDG1835380.1 metal-dependent hydrolase [Pseudomonadales bacterium]MDG1910693.1 metal-dependent hydrolase [Pseudomonadales bacterium]|tara:strand:+ start:2317 stop:3135 length:819 start_codon:yes stop_codon:yes gene_type:complete